MSIFYLVEDDDASLDYSDGTIVSLTPKANESLRRRGLKYKIIEDYYSEKELCANEVDYFDAQLKWFDEFDEFLKKNISFCHKYDIGLAAAHHNRIIYLVDSLIIRARILEEFVKNTKPSEIRIVSLGTKNEGDFSIYNFFRKERWSLLPLIKLNSNEKIKGISVRWMTRDLAETKALFSPSNKTSPFSQLAKPVFKECIAPFKRYFYYKKIADHLIEKPAQSLHSILLLDAGSAAIDFLMGKVIRSGGRVFFKDNDEISLINSLTGQKQKISEASSLETMSHEECKKAADKLAVSGLLEWVNQYTNLDITAIVEPYLRHFIERIIPKIIKEIRYLLDFLKQNSVDAIVARASVGENYTAALLAAQILNIPRICFQHSVGPLDMKSWVVDELNLFDHNFAISTPSRQYFEKEAAQNPKFSCKIRECSDNLLALKKQRKQPQNAKPCLIYCPSKVPFGMRHFNTLYYPVTWYFEFQKQILTLLSNNSEYDIIYKHLDSQEWANQSVIPWLKEKNFQNIQIKTGPFKRYLNKADRVLFDYPSTGLFETAAAGIPVFSLCYDSGKIWPSMQEVFGRSLQYFSDIQDALDKISGYLKDPADLYKINLPLSDSNNSEYLSRIIARKKEVYV